MSVTIIPGRVAELSPLVRRVTQNNPGPMTGPGTNTYLIGRRSVFVVDPGENSDEHFKLLMRAIGSASVLGIAPSHAHPDHWPMAPRLAEALGARTYGFKAHNGFEPSCTLSDGDVVQGPDWTLQALHTPGHVSDHLSYFLRGENALFSGDHVMGWSTSVISRPDGSLTSYLASLKKLLSMEITVIYPAHGEPVREAAARIRELIEHRRMRTAQVLATLHGGAVTVPEIVRQIYADLRPELQPAACQSVLAHLDALVESGRVQVTRPSADPLRSTYALTADSDP